MTKGKLLFLILLMLSRSVFASGDHSLSDGLYIYEFEKITTNPDMEKMYADMGVQMKVYSIENYSSVIVKVTGGAFQDPVVQIDLTIDPSGRISSPGNSTVAGTYDKDGSIRWSGSREHYGTRADMTVTGTLRPVPVDLPAPPELNGTYHLMDEMMDREMIATVENGYLTFEPVVKEPEDELSSGWPVLVKSDGTFYSGIEFITRTEITYAADTDGTLKTTTADSTTYLSLEGSVSIQSGMIFNFYRSSSSAVDRQGDQGRTIYAGRKISDAQLADLDRETGGLSFNPDTGGKDVKGRKEKYPDWYLNPPAREGFYIGTGSKKLGDKDSAVRAAETFAAAGLALQIQVDVTAVIEYYTCEVEMDDITVVKEFYQSATEQISSIPLDYTVEKVFYDEKTKTACVMVSISKEKAYEAVRNSFQELERNRNTDLKGNSSEKVLEGLKP